MRTADKLGLPRRARRRDRRSGEPVELPEPAPAPVPPKPLTRPGLMRSLFSGGGSSAIHHAFELMGVCEQELRLAELDALSRTTNLFLLLCAPPSMFEPTVSPEVYRAHARELLGRVKRADDIKTRRFNKTLDLSVPTKAELLMALHFTSLKAPLKATHALIMEQCFEHVFPGWTDKQLQTHGHLVEAKRATRKLEAAEQEVLDGLMVSLRVDDRKLVPK